MNRLGLWAMAIIIGCLALPRAAPAASLVASHSGLTNPTTEGWTVAMSGPGNSAVGANDGGTPTWIILDNSLELGSALWYEDALSGPELTTALTSGWRLRARVRAENVEGDGFTQFIGFSTGATVYQVHFRSESYPDLTVLLFEGYPPFTGPTFTVPNGATTYHTYELVSDGVSGTATLLIDDVPVYSGYAGFAHATTVSSRFGCGTSLASGFLFANSVEFWIGPAVELRGSIGQPMVGIASGSSSTILSGVWHLRGAGPVVAVPPVDPLEQPVTFSLSQNAPNPFDGATRIRFTLPERDHVSLRVFDVTGRAVRNVADDVFAPGAHEVAVSMGGLAPGLYFYRLFYRNSSLTKKMLLLDRTGSK